MANCVNSKLIINHKYFVKRGPGCGVWMLPDSKVTLGQRRQWSDCMVAVGKLKSNQRLQFEFVRRRVMISGATYVGPMSTHGRVGRSQLANVKPTLSQRSYFHVGFRPAGTPGQTKLWGAPI